MLHKKNLDIVIPVYNESDIIVNTLRSIQNNFEYEYNILICYDFETDNTLPKIKQSNLILKNIFFIKNVYNGAHGAVMSGIQNSKSDHVLVLPADDDYNTENLKIMYEKIKDENLDILCPDRFINKNSIKSGPFFKFLLAKFVNYTLYYFTDVPTKDATNGFRFFSRRVLENIKIESKIGFTYSIEYLLKSMEKGYNIGKFPAIWIERKKGKSRFKILIWSLDYLRWYFYAFKLKLFK